MNALLDECQERTMRSRLLAMLAMLVLLGVACVAHADYIVIIADLNAKSPAASSGGAGGMTGGGGMMGGSPTVGGMGGMGGGPPPSFGPRGGPPPGGMGMMGMMGMMGGMGAPPPGVMGTIPPGAEDADDIPNIVVAVVEVTPKTETFYKLFEIGKVPSVVDAITGNHAFHHRWGKAPLFHKNYAYQVDPLRKANGKVLPSVKVQFKQLSEDVSKTKPSTDDLIKQVATWALEHNLLEEFVKEMDKIAEKDKTHPLVEAFLKTKEGLARSMPKSDLDSKWKGKLLPSQRVTQADGSHFAILHAADLSPEDVKTQVDRLEKSYHSFFYWWALQRTLLPMPRERLAVVIAGRPDQFRRLHEQLTPGPVVSDSFYAPREGLSVFSRKRTDAAYGNMEMLFTSTYKEYHRKGLITGDPAKGVPFDPQGKIQQRVGALLPRTYALMMKAMEEEWEANATSHEVGRQLMYSTGLLPRNVHVPEWVQFGMGSFFETPLQSPWGGAGTASPYWLPRFKEYVQKDASRSKNKQRYGDPGTLMAKVVTDSFFRAREPSPDDPIGMQEYRTLQRYGEAASWSLNFFLAHREMPKLLRYYKELSRMPRDMDLDDKVLEICFARAFECLNPDRSIDKQKWRELADRWLSFVNDQPLEADAVHKQIRDYYAKMALPSGPTGGGVGTTPLPTKGTGTTTGRPPRQPNPTAPRPGTGGGGIRRPFMPRGR